MILKKDVKVLSNNAEKSIRKYTSNNQWFKTNHYNLDEQSNRFTFTPMMKTNDEHQLMNTN